MIDATTESFVFEITGKSDKIDQFVELMLPLGLVEVSRTGVAAIARGAGGDVTSLIAASPRLVAGAAIAPRSSHGQINLATRPKLAADVRGRRPCVFITIATPT